MVSRSVQIHRIGPEWGEFYVVMGDVNSVNGPNDWVMIQTMWDKTMWDRRNSPHLNRCFCSLGVVPSVPQMPNRNLDVEESVMAAPD